ncbi:MULTISPECIES: DUF6274 family protein [unclassified Streptomyces]|uniref:DUF6274 family protein n=1 Tax=unclassified Streptomyces TaxID=2593676 RepID=UPI00081E9BD7|nr:MULTISPECIES: DUF6274 family protein [unclassified Streptomyces]MYR97465.1 hypothetical protein [Streptomyces sp. SID4937]SCE25859.1 hypothetical protein GA0115243_109428 [Streptomyces sp. ScaeMP-e83]
MSASTARHETRALLRAHLAAAYGYGHLTRHCPVCHRLLRLAMEPGDGEGDIRETRGPEAAPEPPHEPQEPRERAGSPSAAGSAPAEPAGDEDERPSTP